MAGVNRTVKPPRSPYPGVKVGYATFGTIGVEAGDARNVPIQLQSQFRKDISFRGHVRAYLSADANGDSVVPFYNLPTSIAIGTDGLLVPVNKPSDALLATGTILISGVAAEKFKTTATAEYLVGRKYKTKAATDNLVLSAAHVVTASKFGIILIQINAAGTVSTVVPAATPTTAMAYNTAALAVAAMPAPTAGNVPLGYIIIEADSGGWIGITDDMTNGSDLTTATFVDWPVNGDSFAEFDLTSESDGDIDINITTTQVITYYLAIRLPDGSLVVSGAIAFA